MNWRHSLRRIRALFGLPVDQADAYMRQHSPHWASEFTPSATASYVRSAARRRPPSVEFGPYWALYLEAAEELLQTGTVTVRADRATASVRLLRFADGTGVLEQLEGRGPYAAMRGTGRTRIERGQLTVPIIAKYLEQTIATLDPKARSL